MKNQTITKLSEYQPYPFHIPEIFLNFSILKTHINIVSVMKLIPKSENTSKLVLKGIDIRLEKILINNYLLSAEFYSLQENKLIINNIPNKEFIIEIHSKINPYDNTSLEGLYSSSEILTTQCEAEGFRRISFHPDRPDVLSKFKVRIEADINHYPVLLSNGNKISSSLLKDLKSRHEVVWEDPFPKPSYLFALVAGNLSNVNSKYRTITGRDISINIFVEEGDQIYTKHAIDSLKKAMLWDEEVYGLEYDLDEYNIVAIRHFNMGAMENKGLNIFNSKLVLADSEITTDSELERIESVIAHEYFHNWTGNRITCRDWFQLSLKEGLTVFRDQSFTSDLHSAALKRIEDVSFLRSTQFKEDAGPTSHPVKPSKYISIDNFYTTTIYEKGAELIRMLQTLLGNENFMLGIKNYIKCFDGTAATTEDFIYSTIEGANKNGYNNFFNVDQFLLWYNQAGTPIVSIKRNWNQNEGKLILSIKQNFNSFIKGRVKKTMVIPIKISIISDNSVQQTKLIVLEKENQIFEFNNLPKVSQTPILSLFQNFSAPVNWESDLSSNELLDLIDLDNDLFSKWDTIQRLLRSALLSRASNNPDLWLENSLIKAFKRIIINYSNDNLGFLDAILTIPPVTELESYQDLIDPNSLYESYIYFFELFGNALCNELIVLLKICYKNYQGNWPKGQGERKLIKRIWALLCFDKKQKILPEIVESVNGSSMTLSMAALNALMPIDCIERDQAMKSFYNRWQNKPVILDTWFNLEASIPRVNSLELTKGLLKHPRFDSLAPNSIRAVLGGFSKNSKAFHSRDGQGYMFMAEQIICVDKRNPITASRLSKIFSRWNSYIQPNSHHMKTTLEFLNDQDLSSNTREVVELMLNEAN